MEEDNSYGVGWSRVGGIKGLAFSNSLLNSFVNMAGRLMSIQYSQSGRNPFSLRSLHKKGNESVGICLPAVASFNVWPNRTSAFSLDISVSLPRSIDLGDLVCDLDSPKN